MSDLLTRLQAHGATLHAGDDSRITCTTEQAALAILDVTGVDVEWEARQQAQVPGFSDPTDPGHDVNVLREHVRHLERRVRQLTAEAALPGRPAGAAYYGSNWEEVRKLYTEAQMRAYGEQCAAAARLAEREECAKVCEQWGAWNNTAHDIAAAIRARRLT